MEILFQILLLAFLIKDVILFNWLFTSKNLLLISFLIFSKLMAVFLSIENKVLHNKISDPIIKIANVMIISDEKITKQTDLALLSEVLKELGMDFL